MTTCSRSKATRAAALFLPFALLAGAAPAAAQVVQGYVIEDGSALGVRNAAVSLLGLVSDSLLARMVAPNAEFYFGTGQAGWYRLRVEALGYVPLETQPFHIAPGAVVTLELRLRADAIALDPVVVVAERREPLFMPGVRERQRLGFGRVLLRHELAELAGYDLESALQTMVGVRVQRFGSDPTAPPVVHTRASVMGGTGSCYADLYVDGMRWFSSDRAQGGLDPMDAVNLHQFFGISLHLIEAIEIYRGAAQVPAEFSGTTAECGVVAVWMRRSLLGEDDYVPPLLHIRPRGHIDVGAGAVTVSGLHAPAPGAGISALMYWPVPRGIHAGVHVAASMHRLAGSTTDELTSSLPPTYQYPPGARTLLLVVGGGEARAGIGSYAGADAMAAVRLLAARRSFSLPSSAVGHHAVPISSLGAGAGASLGGRRPLRGGFDFRVTLDADWLFFTPYEALEREWNPTGGTWRRLSLRLGLDRTM
jgi:hypothetical protein